MIQQQLTPAYLRQQIIGIDEKIQTPFGERLMLYADYTASGRGLHFIEDYLKQLLHLYANSHTEDDTSGHTTTQLLQQAEAIIKQAVNAGPDGRIIACGSGATAAIDRMQQIIGVKLPAASRAILSGLMQGYLGPDAERGFATFCQRQQPVVFVGPYEHHSNEVSWREGLATVVEVRLTAQGAIDLAHLEQLLQQDVYRDRLRIGSFSAASNVTGICSPVAAIARLLHRYNALAFFDYAASAPYVAIDMNPSDAEGDASIDALFISPHKFLGGPGASGVLVFNKRCYHSELPPSIAGGGTVDYVGSDDHDFVQDIEVRENAGTPGILQTLKAALVFQVKQAVGIELIEARETAMIQRTLARWGRNPQIDILGNPDPLLRVAIVSFNIRGPHGDYLHPRFVTRLLDDLFGIQSRAGCSCAGPYGHQLLGINDSTARKFRQQIANGACGLKPGWCRIGFHYVFDDAEVDYLLDAVEFVALHGHLFLPLYDFDLATGLWQHGCAVQTASRLCLADALNAGPSVASAPASSQRKAYYLATLQFARELVEKLASEGADETVRLPGQAGELQFFQLSKLR